jgi:hypothetical protein
LYKGCFFPTSSPALVGGVLDGSHSNRSEMESQCGFVLISFMARDGEHFFMCLLAVHTSSFEQCLLSSFNHIFLELLILYILVMNLLSDEYLAMTFSCSLGSLFSVVTVSFAVQKFFSQMQSHLSILSLTC